MKAICSFKNILKLFAFIFLKKSQFLLCRIIFSCRERGNEDKINQSEKLQFSRFS